MVSRSRPLALQLNLILLCFSQTHLVSTGPHQELGDVITRHNNGQATLFPHFPTLPARNKIILNWTFTIKLFFLSDFQQDVNRCTHCIRTCYLVIRSCLVRWWRDGDDGKLALSKHVWSRACVSGSSMRRSHWGRRSQEAGGRAVPSVGLEECSIGIVMDGGVILYLLACSYASAAFCWSCLFG
jgi:hypothetical protein